MYRLFRSIAIVLAVTASGQAWSVADIRGVVGAIAATGQCNDTQQMAVHADTLTLKAATACAGDSAAAELRADAASESIGLRGQATGSPQGSSQASGSVNLTDRLLLSVPTGTLGGTIFHIPVTFSLDGLVSAGALYDPVFGRFLDYNLSIDTFGIGYQKFGRIASTGAFNQTFSGVADLYYVGGSTPFVADLSLQLDLVSLVYGTVDFLHTATFSLDLPTGVTVTNSSGVPLFVKAVTPTGVPEPSDPLLLVIGLLALACALYSRRGPGQRAVMGECAA